MPKIIIIIVVTLLVIVGGFFAIRSTMQKVYNAPISDNPVDKNTLSPVEKNTLIYRMSQADIKLGQINPLFKKYYPLILKGNLYLLDSIVELTAKNNLRPLDASGSASVTVIKAARGLYAHPNNDTQYPFLKMHVEQSTQQNFEKDKQTVIRFIEDMPNIPNSSLEKMETGNYKGIEYYFVDTNATKTTGVKGTTEIFFPKDQMIVTIYFLTQPPGKESYKTQEEYKALKTEFIQEIIDSAIKNNN